MGCARISEVAGHIGSTKETAWTTEVARSTGLTRSPGGYTAVPRTMPRDDRGYGEVAKLVQMTEKTHVTQEAFVAASQR